MVVGGDDERKFIKKSEVAKANVCDSNAAEEVMTIDSMLDQLAHKQNKLMLQPRHEAWRTK